MADFPLSSAELARITQAIKNIEFDIDRLASKLVDKTTKVGRAVKDVTDQAGGDVKKQVDRIDEMYEHFETENIFRFQRLAKSMVTSLGGAWLEIDKDLDKADRKFKQFGAEVKRHMTEARGGIGAAGSVLGVQGAVGAAGGMMSQLTAQIPGGGLIGLALFGKMKDTEFAARAHTAGRAFEQVGNMGMGVVGRLTGMAKSMFAEWGMDPGSAGAELGALTGAFAKFGVSGEMAMQKLDIRTGRFGSSIMEVSFAMDTLTKSATGTFAEAISLAAQNSGQDIKQVANEVIALGLNLRNTGANVGQFISTLMQATSGLRLQRQGVSDLARSYAFLQAGLGAGVLSGASQQAVTARTLSGITAIAGGISQMPEGLSAVLGERISAKSGKPTTGIDALMEMQRGAAGQGGAFMGEVVRELGALTQEITGGGDRNKQVFALQKVLPSLGFEGAEAVVAINEAIEQDLAKGLTFEESVAKHQDALNKAFMSRDKEQSEFEKVMKKATLALVDIGIGMLGFVGVMAASFRPDALIGVLKTALGRATSPAEDKAMAASKRASDVFWDQGIKKITGGLSRLGALGLDIVDTTVPDVPVPGKGNKGRPASSAASDAVFQILRDVSRTVSGGMSESIPDILKGTGAVIESVEGALGKQSVVVPINRGVDAFEIKLIRMAAGSPSILAPV